MTATTAGAMRFACQTYSWQMSGDAYKGRLDHMAAVASAAGFAGIEPEVVMLGGYDDADGAGRLLADHRLELAGLAYAARWAQRQETPEERAEADRLIAFLSRFPETMLVLVQLPGADRSDLAERRRNAIACMDAVARRARHAGLRVSVHPNSPPGSVFRTAEDYEVLLEGLDPALSGFTPDLGHLAAGGMDPLEVVKRYRDRVDHVHFKDIHEDGRWAPTGAGCLDFPGVVAYLRDTGYTGWLVFEDESEAVERDPDSGARRNGAYARDVLAPLLAGDGAGR
jgi:inosose dehydratase